MSQRALGALALGLVAAVALLLVVSGDAGAVGESVELPPGNGTVLEGRSVGIRVYFGVRDQSEDVSVTCSECPTWTARVNYNPDRRNCGVREQGRACDIDFPADFPPADDGDPTPSQLGEPSQRGTYLVTVGDQTAEDIARFDVYMSTAYVCRDGNYQRGQRLLATSSGHARGDTIEFTIKDLERGEVVLDETRTSAGSFVAYDIVWHPSLNYDLGNDNQRRIEIRAESDSKTETETFTLEPAVAEAVQVEGPGFRDQDKNFSRTHTVRYSVVYGFLARPLGCTETGGTTDPTIVTGDMLGDDPLRGTVYKKTNVEINERRNVSDTTFARFDGSTNRFIFDYTVPRDAEATRNTTNPQQDDGGSSQGQTPLYEIQVPETELVDGNFIEENHTADYRVWPYHIQPEFIEIQEEVERLETARLVVNLTYADGSGFTPNDTNAEVTVEFGPADGGTRFNRTLEHQQAGRWNASAELDFDHHPIEPYVWRVQATSDDNGQRPTTDNTIEHAVSDVVDVVGARPLIDLQTFVGSEAVNGTQRTQTVHVGLHADYKNGEPLTEENVDPSLGGVQLRVKKTNQFGRVLAVEPLTMTASGDHGEWVRSFRVGRSETQAPIGEWQLEVVARDDSEVPNENITSFPFPVRPAQLEVSPLRHPPPLVDGGEIEYRIRLTYPDGTLLTERLVEPNRGGELTIQLERIRGVGQAPAVEQTFNPQSTAGGQSWRVTLDSSKMVPGNHFFNVSGEDIYGNQVGPTTSRLFTVLFDGEFRNSTTPICPKLEEGERCERERGSEIFAIFPGSEGDKGLQVEDPEVRVLRKVPGEARWMTHKENVRISGQEFFNLTGERVDNAHVGYFQTDESTPEGRYRLYVIGRAEDDTGFAGYSQAFNITPITVDRTVLKGLPASTDKLVTLTGTVEHKRGDVIDEVYAQAGRVRSGAVQVTPTPVGWVLEWTPSMRTPSGPATIHAEGRDVFGNPFEIDLGPVRLRPMDVGVSIVQAPDPEVPRRGSIETQAELTFPDGSVFRRANGQPEVLIRNAQGEQVDTGRAFFSQDRWELNWRPEPDVPLGLYTMEITGTDSAGNVIETVQTTSFEVVPGTVSGQIENEPGDVRRGGVTRARISFDSEIAELNATVTTGSEVLGSAQIQRENKTARLSFPTTRTTPLVQAFFDVTGSDIHGNDLRVDTSSFQVDPMQLTIRFVSQPPPEVPKEKKATARFVIEYPDGTRLRPGQGSPIVGLFLRNSPRGIVEDVKPMEQNPTVWRIQWDPPEDTLKDIPFHFSVSALDRWQNEATPTASRGFFVTNPVVPDYLPAPGPGPWVALAALVGLAGALGPLRRER